LYPLRIRKYTYGKASLLNFQVKSVLSKNSPKLFFLHNFSVPSHGMARAEKFLMPSGLDPEHGSYRSFASQAGQRLRQ
jgi:hypothetical protein